MYVSGKTMKAVIIKNFENLSRMEASGNTIKAVIIYKFRNWEHTLMDARGNQIKVLLRQMKMKEVTI